MNFEYTELLIKYGIYISTEIYYLWNEFNKKGVKIKNKYGAIQKQIWLRFYSLHK